MLVTDQGGRPDEAELEFKLARTMHAPDVQSFRIYMRSFRMVWGSGFRVQGNKGFRV